MRKKCLDTITHRVIVSVTCEWVVRGRYKAESADRTRRRGRHGRSQRPDADRGDDGVDGREPPRPARDGGALDGNGERRCAALCRASHRRRGEDEGRLLPELDAYFAWFFRFSSRSSRDRRRSRSAETSSRRRSASGSAPSRLASVRGEAIPHPAREAQSWTMRSASRWLETMPSRLDFIDRCTKSCHASPCLMSWWRNAVGSAARWARSFSRMI